MEHPIDVIAAELHEGIWVRNTLRETDRGRVVGVPEVQSGLRSEDANAHSAIEIGARVGGSGFIEDF